MDQTPLATEPTSAALTSAITALRWAVGLVGGYAIGKGWLDKGTLDAIGALVVALAPAVYGVWKSYWHARALKAAAPRVPDSIIASK